MTSKFALPFDAIPGLFVERCGLTTKLMPFSTSLLVVRKCLEEFHGGQTLREFVNIIQVRAAARRGSSLSAAYISAPYMVGGGGLALGVRSLGATRHD
jgi:hypothetical protein